MTEQPNNLNIDSLLSKDDMNKLVELLGQNSVSLGGGNSKKKNKMTPQAKNFLLNQLSSHQKIQDVQKPFKDMNEEEKKIYRDELKSRLHNKQNIFKQNRTNHNLLQKTLDAKLKKNSDAKNKTNETDETIETDEATETNEIDAPNEVTETNILKKSDTPDVLVQNETTETTETNKMSEHLVQPKLEESEKLEDFVN